MTPDRTNIIQKQDQERCANDVTYNVYKMYHDNSLSVNCE